MIKYCIPLLLFSVSAQSATVLTNGSFESGNFDGWSSSGNVTASPHLGNPCCAASEGAFYANFNGGDLPVTGKLSQSFLANPGTQYVLEFYFAKGGPGNGTAALQVEVEGISSLLDVEVSSIVGGEPGPYSSFQYGFVADNDLVTLSFYDISSGTISFDALIDNVAIEAVPLPASAWLFCSVLVVVGSKLRQRRISTSSYSGELTPRSA